MNKKNLLKISQKLLQLSLVNGNINSAKVKKSLDYVKSLPKEKAILILTGYIKLLKSHLSKTTAEVTTAIPISSAQKKYTQSIIGHLKFDIRNLTFSEDPSLLGGVRVKIGDVVYDNSIQRKIKETERVIKLS